MCADTTAHHAALTEDQLSLPAWTYTDPEFLAAERQKIFAPSWQIVCHISDLPVPGCYHSLEILGDSIIAVRGQDGIIRAFHNVCRHRAARLLDGHAGRCGGRIVCPYHAWTYALSGELIGLPDRRSFAQIDRSEHGLAAIELEIWRGFVFIRLQPGAHSVAQMMAPYDHEIAQYRFEDLVPLGRVTLRIRDVNWKNIGDNYSDALHITIAHPGLTRLFGKSYGVESQDWADKMWGELADEPSASLSERLYQKYLPPVPHLPASRQRLWTYYKLWPNLAFDVYPDQVDFMQSIPVSATQTIIRETAYVLPDSRREMRAARYLNWRINRQVSLEDKALIERVQQGMNSSSYSAGPLGDGEVSLKSFGRHMRHFIPQSRLPQKPPSGWNT